MGGGDFTGNGSVEWDVQGDNVRQHNSRPTGPMAQEQSGIDETPEGRVQYFTIVIKRPRNPTEHLAFVDSLRKELDSGNDRIVVKLPIEDQDHGGPTHNQISVRWPSRPPNVTFKGGAAEGVAVGLRSAPAGS